MTLALYKITLWSLVAAAVGCVHPHYVFIPQENATARIAGRTAALYSVPPDNPQGEVELTSLGVQRFQHGPPTMHIRLIVFNDSPNPWVVDTRRQIMTLPAGQRLRPLYATSSVAAPPRVHIAPEGDATIDLYYPLPAGAEEMRELPEFKLTWRVRAGPNVISERTRFDRYRVEPFPPYPGWGPYWRYEDDFYGPGWEPHWYWDDWDDDFD